ncbi:aromatic di-alanine and TPR containing protein, partial [Rhizoctonia solani AG-3 Rhs1AP]
MAGVMLYMGPLGASYTYRYRRLSDLTDLDKAIDCTTHALALTPDDHPKISERHAGMGTPYTDRYKRLGELTDLEKAMACATRALALTPAGHPDMPDRHASLGVSYMNRYRRLNELADLEKSIECLSRALALTPDGHPDMPQRHAALGTSYFARYRHLDRHASLGVSYNNGYRRSGELADLDKAIEYHIHGLALAPTGHPNLTKQYLNYALSLLQKFKHTRQSTCLVDCWEAFRKASQDFTGAPHDKFHHALRWASVASELIFFNPIVPYRTAIDLLPQFIWLGVTASQRYQNLSMAKTLATDACFEAILCSDHSLALEWLEHARCVVWSQSLMLRSPLDQLHSSCPDLATQIQSVASQLDNSSFQPQLILTTLSDSIDAEQAGRQRRRLAVEYHSLLTQIRQLPGFETFLQPSKASELVGAVRDGPVVVINCHWHQCDALLIMPGSKKVGHLALPDFTEKKARQARSELEVLLKQRGLRQRGVRVRPQPGFEDGIESVLRILWSNIIKPVLDYLGYIVETTKPLPHITWCPTGPLSFLPLHAAGDYSQTESRIYNYAVSSYIPTLSALLVSNPRALKQDCRILAIGQANTPEFNPLPGTIKELKHIKAQTHNKAQYSQLIGDQATTAAVLDAMEQHDWVHLACHAHQNVDDPTQSGFFLHDGTLDLSAINRRSFKDKGLAFLSACQTASGDEKLPDEAIHLASGFHVLYK